MSESVGQINLDLAVNQGPFQRQMASIQNIAVSAGKALAGAFAVKKLVEFGKSCVELGSNLTEVQNVVDVTFPSMTKQVNDFAQSAASNFGLSETMAKKFTGTFGAMAKSFGFNEQSAYNMSTALTGLSGDVASFYNISQDEAYTKLKSVFTGETETLKELGIVMTENALDAYAMTNGYGKTTKQMTEAEKVALRFAFVQDKLKLATGDFSRTQDSWANQTRLLKLQFDSLKTSIGQGLIMALSPALKALNSLVAKLGQAAQAFKNFMSTVTGKTDEDTSNMTGNIDGAVNATGDLTSGLDSTAQSAKNAKKEIEGLMGFDEINKLGDSSDDNDDTDNSNLDNSNLGNSLNLDKANNSIGTSSALLDGLIDKAKELADQFKNGFNDGLGKDFDTSIERTKEHLANISKNLRDIFTNKDIQDAANNCVNKLVYNMGKIAGSFVSVGQSILENIVGGFDKCLSREKGRIKQWLINMFDIYGAIYDIEGNFAEAIATIFESLRSDAAKNCTSAIIQIFTDAFMNVIELLAKLNRDVLEAFTQPFIDNAEYIKETITNTLAPVSEVWQTIADVFQGIWDNIQAMYDEHIAPMLQAFGQGWSDLTQSFLDAYNQYILPVINNLAPLIEDFWTNHFKPMADSAIELIGKIADAVKDLWQRWLQPLIQWCIDNIMPILAPILNWAVQAIIKNFNAIADAIGGLFRILGGIIDFLVGAFTGDWNKAWNGIVEVFGTIWDGIVDIVKDPLNYIIDCINECIDGMNDLCSVSIPGFGSIGVNIPTIPKLATGGYVKANTPQLAMIGDNTHEGEIVAPESKIAEAVSRGIANVIGNVKNTNSDNNRPLQIILQVGDTVFGQAVVESINTLTKANGASGLII